MAKLVSGSPTWASSSMTRRSQARAISRPPPNACPLRIATVGWGRAAMSPTAALISRTHSFTWESSIPLRSLRSAPAQKARSPAPVRTTTQTASSAATSEAVARRARRASRESAFRRSGRSRIMVATLPFFSRRTGVESGIVGHRRSESLRQEGFRHSEGAFFHPARGSQVPGQPHEDRSGEIAAGPRGEGASTTPPPAAESKWRTPLSHAARIESPARPALSWR